MINLGLITDGHSVSFGSVTSELAGRERHNWMSLAHSGLSTQELSNVGAGWHAHLSLLISAMRAEAMALSVSLTDVLPRHERQAAMRVDARA